MNPLLSTNGCISRVVIAAMVLSGPVLRAGTESYDYKEAPPTITQGEPWQFTLAAPGWLASTTGTIGVRGINADIDVGVDQILQHLDMIFSMRAEAQKGPFGIYTDLLYVGLSDNTQINGLINNIHEQVDQLYFNGGLSWRLFNQPRWSLDFAAGSHYANVYEQLELHSDSAAIGNASERFVTNISDDLRARLNQDISKTEFLAQLRTTIETDIVSQIDKHNALDRHQRRPTIPIGPLAGRIHQDVAGVVEDLIRGKETALRIRVDALHLKGAARRAAVNRLVSAAEAQITHDVQVTLNSKLDQTISRDDYWFDPYVGLHSRYNFNKTFYTAVRGEIGGFGVGADLMWQVETVVGVNLTRCVFTEIGFRALGIDYNNDKLLFDAVVHGPQITTGITF